MEDDTEATLMRLVRDALIHLMEEMHKWHHTDAHTALLESAMRQACEAVPTVRHSLNVPTSSPLPPEIKDAYEARMKELREIYESYERCTSRAAVGAYTNERTEAILRDAIIRLTFLIAPHPFLQTQHDTEELDRRRTLLYYYLGGLRALTVGRTNPERPYPFDLQV